MKAFQAQSVEHTYIHIPFCRHLCTYCDFCVLPCSDILQTRTSKTAKFIRPYLQALQHEITAVALNWRKQRPDLLKPLKSLYFGGGTPGILQTEELAALISLCREQFGLTDACEITLELNPCNYQHLDLKYLHKLGLNRVSLGLQTSDLQLLKFLEREHRAEDAVAAVDYMRAAGIDNISLDLIVALPGQDMAAVAADLAFVLNLKPQHVSVYSLILEAGSKLYQLYARSACCQTRTSGANSSVIKALPSLPDEDTEREMVHYVQNTLCQSGFRHYEISNFALTADFESRHNTAVWAARPYFGFGLSAGSYLAGVRRTNTRQIKHYIDAWKILPPNSADLSEKELYRTAILTEKNTQTEAMEDYFAFALRYLCGVKISDFEKYFACAVPARIKEILDWGCGQNLLQTNEQKSIYYVTEKGQDYLDEISRRLLGCLQEN